MAEVVWFGTKNYMQWVAAPAVDVGASKSNSGTVANFTHGGAWVRRSKGGSRTYSFSWNKRPRDEMRVITDYADGIYGNGYLYYLDPMAMNKNALPTYWASPFVNYYDGPVIIDGVRPTLITNSTSVNGYPIESVQYTVTSTSNVPSVFIPIPPGYTAHIGAHGSLISGNASVKVTPVIGPLSVGTAVNLTLLTPSSTTRTNHTVAASGGYIGIYVSFASTSTGVIQLDGLIAQVLLDGETVPTGGFISGQGSSGLQFKPPGPSVSQYSAALDMVGVSADLIETEAWQWL